MRLQEILDRRVERVRRSGWGKGSYLKVDYLGDEVSPMVSYVNPKFQKLMQMPVGNIRLILEDAFGKMDDWEEYNGPKAFGF